ncbi:MAG: arylesterase [Gammaproteobacteria bacterium]|nr:arylesterase [Gammaproteobacteria bacterium]
MNKIILKFAALFHAALLLSAGGCGPGNPEIAPLAADAEVLAFGNSLTYGTGAKNAETYPAILEQLILREVINAGIPGEITKQGLARLPALLDEIQPDLLILCHGGNDFLGKIDASQTIANLKAMIQLAKDQDIDVILIGVPEIGVFLSPPEFYREIAEEFRIPYQSTILAKILADRSLKSDPIHPNAQGYRKIAEALTALLKKSKAL